MIGFVRMWREGIIGALAIAMGLALVGKAAAERKAQALETRLASLARTLAQEREAVRAQTARARAEDAAHAARVERDQMRVSQEKADEYQVQLAELRRRYDALRLRAAAVATDPGGGRGETMPRLPPASESVDGAARDHGFPRHERLIASEQALRLHMLQEWIRAQTGLSR